MLSNDFLLLVRGAGKEKSVISVGYYTLMPIVFGFG